MSRIVAAKSYSKTLITLKHYLCQRVSAGVVIYVHIAVYVVIAMILGVHFIFPNTLSELYTKMNYDPSVDV